MHFQLFTECSEIFRYFAITDHFQILIQIIVTIGKLSTLHLFFNGTP